MVSRTLMELRVSGNEIAITVGRGTPIEASTSARREESSSWSEVFATILSDPPEHRRIRSVSLIITDEKWRFKRLFGIREGTPPDAVALELKSSPEQFFLGMPEELLTSACVLAEGSWWAAAVDRERVMALAEACEARGKHFVGVRGPEHDGAIIDPARDSRRHHKQIARRGLVLLGIVLALVCAGLAPMLTYSVRAARLERDADGLIVALQGHGSRTDPTRLMREQAHSLAESAVSTAELLARVAAALPDSSAILSFRFDSVGVAMTVIAPPQHDIIQALAQSATSQDLALAGPLVRELIAGVEVQRTVLTFVPLQPSGSGRAARGKSDGASVHPVSRAGRHQ